MRVKLFWLGIGIWIILSNPTVSLASLIKVENDGFITYSVLSSTDEIEPEIPKASSIEITQTTLEANRKSTIALAKNGDKVNVVVNDNGNTREFNLNKPTDVIIEIEERPQVSTLEIGYQGSNFSLKQKNYVALTIFPVKIDSINAKVSVSTDRGERIVSILPNTAVQNLIKAKVINKITGNLELTENESELVYKVSGQRLLNLFDFYKYPVDVSSLVSASTGEIVSIEAPVWFRLVNVFFS